MIANVRAANEERMRSYGVTEIVDHTAAPLPEQVERAHPDGIDLLVDLAQRPGRVRGARRAGAGRRNGAHDALRR